MNVSFGLYLWKPAQKILQYYFATSDERIPARKGIDETGH